MSKYSPLQRGKQYSLNNHKDISRKLQKSNTTTQGLRLDTQTSAKQFNNTTSHLNPYLQQLDKKSTDKKPRHDNQYYHAPVLLQQNRQLMKENQDMALLIHQKNTIIQLLQEKYQAQIEEENSVFREVEEQKARFVKEIIHHQEVTGREIKELEEDLATARQQTQQLMIKMQREMQLLRQQEQRLRINQIRQVQLKFSKKASCLENQKLQLQTQLQQGRNRLKQKQVEERARTKKLTLQIQELKDEIKHRQTMLKSQKSQLKQLYQNKLHKIHLQYRRDKQLFIAQHQAQIKNLQRQIQRQNAQINSLQGNLQLRQACLKHKQNDIAAQQQKKEHQMMETMQQLKEKCHRDKFAIKELMETQIALNNAANAQYVNTLTLQKQRLQQIVSLKSQQNTKLYGQFNQIRRRHCADMQQHQDTVNQLMQKLKTNQVGTQNQAQFLKTKLAVLRQADIKALKEFFQNQINVLNNLVAEKDQIIAHSREKLHDELRKKVELRKQYQVEFSKYRFNIQELNAKISELEIELGTGKVQIRSNQNRQGQKQVQSQRERQKNEKIRQQEINYLQQIIKAKDKEIEQLQSTIDLLKLNQHQQLSRKQDEMAHLQQVHKAQSKDRENSIARLQQQLQKQKQMWNQQHKQYQKELADLNAKRQQQLLAIHSQLQSEKQNHQFQIIQLKKQLRSLSLQIQRQKNRNSQQILQTEHSQRQIQFIQRRQQFQRQKQQLEQFYKRELQLKDQQIADLVQRNAELTNDIMDARQNYANIERKMQNLIQSQSALRDIEHKIMNMGKQNNIVKNISELKTF